MWCGTNGRLLLFASGVAVSAAGKGQLGKFTCAPSLPGCLSSVTPNSHSEVSGKFYIAEYPEINVSVPEKVISLKMGHLFGGPISIFNRSPSLFTYIWEITEC